jgi:hypothetical protein
MRQIYETARTHTHVKTHDDDDDDNAYDDTRESEQTVCPHEGARVRERETYMCC